MLFCRPLPTSTNKADIFNCLDGFMKDIDWFKCVGVTTGGSRARSGKYSGLAEKIKAVPPLVEQVPWSIHREALADKGMNTSKLHLTILLKS